MDRYEWKYIDMALCLSFSAQFKDFSDVFVGFKELKFSFRMIETNGTRQNRVVGLFCAETNKQCIVMCICGCIEGV